MKKQKKSLGCGGYLLSWGVVTVVLCVLFSVINKTGQSMASIIFTSVFIGFFLAFFVWGFYIFFKTKREMKNKNQGGNQQEVENIPTPDMKANVVRQEVPQQSYCVVNSTERQATVAIQNSGISRQVDNTGVLKANEIPNNIRSKDSLRNIPKCNCDGCPKQESCEYGHVIYDEFTHERMTLVDKYMMVALTSSSDENNMLVSDFGIIATNEEIHDKRLLVKLDKEVLYNTLNYLQEVKKTYIAFGKCGRAYFNFMKMGDEISLVKEAIKEYDEYQEIFKQMNQIKSYIMDRLIKENEILQEALYKEFSDVERRCITNAVKELVKEGNVIREKSGNTYKIFKNNA